MVWNLVWVGAAVGLFYGIFIDQMDWLENTFGGALVGFVLSIAVFVGGCFIAADQPVTEQVVSSYDLIALNDGADVSVSGLFFLGSGSISSSEDLEYTFIYKTEKGMTVGERRAKSVYIDYISLDETPRLVTYSNRYVSPFWDWLLGDWNQWEVFYIPKGSITTEFSIDLK